MKLHLTILTPNAKISTGLQKNFMMVQYSINSSALSDVLERLPGELTKYRLMRMRGDLKVDDERFGNLNGAVEKEFF
jgi:hypothetical protein